MDKYIFFSLFFLSFILYYICYLNGVFSRTCKISE